MTLPDPYETQELRQQVETLEQVLKGVYNERARLVAYLAAHHPSHIGYTDPSTPDWPVVTVQTPAGQMSWHIAAADVGLFDRIDPEAPGFAWDGHSTDEKYARLQLLTAATADARTAPQEPPTAPQEPSGVPESPQEPQEPVQAPQTPKEG